MHVRLRAFAATFVASCALSVAIATQPIRGQVAENGRGRTTIQTQSATDRRVWTSRVDAMLRSGELRLRQTRDDPLVPDRTH